METLILLYKSYSSIKNYKNYKKINTKLQIEKLST